MDLYDNPFADPLPPPTTAPAYDDTLPSNNDFTEADAEYDSGFHFGGGGQLDGAGFSQTYTDGPPEEDYPPVQGSFYQQYQQQTSQEASYYQQTYQQEESHYGESFQEPEHQQEQETEQGQGQEQEQQPGGDFSKRRDSVAVRLSTSVEASKAAYEAISRHRSFTAEESPYSKIELSDPEKVEDYTTYKLLATSKDGKRTFLQQRRYQHFEFLFDELVNKYPGVIVPPIPEKKALGRFNAEFVETRRYFLESFLRRLNRHPILMGSQDFRQFVETPKVEETVKSKGLLQLVGGVFSDGANTFSKSHESDKWHEQKRQEVSRLDVQLRKLQKKVETIVKQRKELGGTIASFWNDISTIREESDVFNSLSQLGSIQLKVEEVHQRESSQYVLNFGYTVEEYIRILDSIKIAMNARATCCRVYHLANDKLSKKKDRLDKTMGQADKGDAVTQIVQEVEQAQQEVDVSKKNFEEIDAICQSEMERFDREMKTDFNTSMKNYVEKMVEAQQEITKWWGDFLPEAHQF